MESVFDLLRKLFFAIFFFFSLFFARSSVLVSCLFNILYIIIYQFYLNFHKFVWIIEMLLRMRCDTVRGVVCGAFYRAYELANHILKPIFDIFITSDLASSPPSSPSPPSSDEAYGVLLCDNDDWIRSTRSAATLANSSHSGSGAVPANNFSSSKSHQLCAF